MSAPTLRPYQRDMLDAISSARARGQNRVLCKAPTGTGKTVSFAAMPKWPALADWLRQFPKGDRGMLVIAHREELLDQAADKIAAQNPDLTIGIEQGARMANMQSDVVIASIQTLSARGYKRLRQLIERRTFRLVIVDEAHHAAADTYRTALGLLGFLPLELAGDDETNVEAPSYDDVEKMKQQLAGWDKRAPKDRLLVGVTATPNRTDAIGLGCVFQSIAYSYGLKQAIDDGWLVPIKPWVIETDANLDDVRTNRGDFNQKQLAEAVNTNVRNELAVAGWAEHAAGLQTIAFSVDVAHAHAIADTFSARGVTAAAVSGETPTEERRSMLQAFRDGRLTVLANCMVLTEGTDLPMASCILHAKPTKSPTLYEQMTGRGLRIHPGKTECVVIDVVDVARRHSLQTSPVLYGLPPGLKGEGLTLDELAEKLAALQAENPGLTVQPGERLTLEQLQARARTFDVWKVWPMPTYAASLGMNWIRIDEEAFQLRYPQSDDRAETLTVEKNLLGQFEVKLLDRTKYTENGRVYFRVGLSNTLAAGLQSAPEALARAEQFLREERATVMRLKAKDAPWKSRPASPKQIAYLQKIGVPVDPRKLTMGEASDLIDTRNARRGR